MSMLLISWCLPQPLWKPRPFIFRKLHKRGNNVTHDSPVTSVSVRITDIRKISIRGYISDPCISETLRANLPNRYSSLCWRPVTHAQTWASYRALYRFGRLSELSDIIVCSLMSTKSEKKYKCYYNWRNQLLISYIIKHCEHFKNTYKLN